ncbi:MAG: S1 RNA-binding domain-containing protein, partial [Flexilinea sp.]|nr:S1 RNA-binding domain-containing protein [Flexilinea sp.]
PQIMTEALAQAHEARHFILGKILETIPAPRPELKPHVPRIITVQIPVDKIGAIIGPGGKNIRALQEETNTKIDVEETGLIYISATNAEDSDAARDQILGLVETPILGNIYTGKVVRITDFGAFVEILPNVDDMVHISQLDSERVSKIEDVVALGDELTVMVTGIENGKVRLSRQAVLEGWSLEEAQAADSKKSSGGSKGGNSGGRRGGSGNGNNRNGGNRNNSHR